MIVLDLTGFRKIKLAFESKPSLDSLLDAVRTAYSFDTAHQSYPVFRNLVQDALKQLRTIQAPYVIILSSYHRFNDACGDDDWRAIQIGSYLLNNGAYFSRKPDPADPHFLSGKLASAILDKLETQDWRGLFRDINGLDRSDGYYPREFGILRDESGEYLVLGDSVNGDAYGGIFQIDDAREFEFAGFPLQWDEQGYEAEVDDRLDQGQPIKWTPLSDWAESYLARWDERLHYQEQRRLLPATLELPDPVRTAALAYMAEDNPLAAERVVHEALGFLQASEARGWVHTVKRGLGVDESSPGYLKEACSLVHSGNFSAAIPVLMENAGLSEREARNWVESYIDYLALSSPPSREGGFRDMVNRTFAKWRR